MTVILAVVMHKPCMNFTIESPEHCTRIDKALSLLCPGLSRSRLKALIEGGHVRLNGKACDSPAKKLAAGDAVEIDIPPPAPAHPQSQNINLDIVYEDSDLLVIDKPAGLVVHPGAGNKSGTLVNALLHHCGESLSGIGGVMRPGIVHRLDKDTSGLMVAAKNDRAHQGLAGQLERRALRRVYRAIVFGAPFPPKGAVDQALGRHPSSRLKMAVRRKGGKAAKTFYKVEKKFRDAFSLMECTLETGRTHQIRVHMEFLKHPLVGDRLYGPQASALKSALKKSGYEDDATGFVMDFPRQALHAGEIAFIHPATGEELSFTAAMPQDMQRLVEVLGMPGTE